LNDLKDSPRTNLAKKILQGDKQPSTASPKTLRPMHVKKTLDEALLDAGVTYFMAATRQMYC